MQIDSTVICIRIKTRGCPTSETENLPFTPVAFVEKLSQTTLVPRHRFATFVRLIYARIAVSAAIIVTKLLVVLTPLLAVHAINPFASMTRSSVQNAPQIVAELAVFIGGLSARFARPISVAIVDL